MKHVRQSVHNPALLLHINLPRVNLGLLHLACSDFPFVLQMMTGLSSPTQNHSADAACSSCIKDGCSKDVLQRSLSLHNNLVMRWIGASCTQDSLQVFDLLGTDPEVLVTKETCGEAHLPGVGRIHTVSCAEQKKTTRTQAILLCMP